MTDVIDDLALYSSDPLGFVYWAFPWNEPGELEKFSGPEAWQIELLTQLREGLLSPGEAIQLARTSGHGVGKSAIVAWIILWAISTFEDTVGVVTANTENQLKTKTWVQVAKWYRLFIAKDLFKMTATGLFAADPEHERTWRIDMVPWSERNTEAFAGLHNQGKRILVVFDEASAIPDNIWEVTEGALTDEDTQIIWAVFGNPTRNKGRFRECFPGGTFAHRWRSDVVDSRLVSFTNKNQFQRWIDDYGEDSDFVRVRVLGKFPRVDGESFIPFSLAMEATLRDVEPQFGHPVVLGVDVGRFGDDPSIIYPRKGRDARTLPIEVYFQISTMELAARVADAVNRYSASIALVDEGGVGGGVVDRLRQLRVPVLGVDFGSKPDGYTDREAGVKYANKRAEIWGAVKEWLNEGAIPKVAGGGTIDLVAEATGPNYGLNAKEAIQLESKKDMRARGVPSPNVLDALACTFAFPVYTPPASGRYEEEKPTIAADYDPFARERIYA
jgi:hypothetical protein